MKKGKLITIEGIDGVGKNTQATLLKDYIIKQKGACGFFSFPRYETETGKQVGAYLRGELGELTLMERADLYAKDRLAAREEMLSYLDSGIDVVCDRYVVSNIIYFRALAMNEGMSDKDVEEIIDRIQLKEFKVNRMPAIDALIILTLPLAMSTELVLSKKTRNYTADKQDLHEKQVNLQLLANQGYNLTNFAMHVVVCNKDDKILSIDQIHDLVVKKYIQLTESEAVK